jgi:transposase
MFGLSVPPNIYLSTRPTDMRKSINGLCGEVQNFLGRSSTDGSLFVFINHRRDKVKLLFWDNDGYWLWYKRLEAGTFQIPLLSADASGVILEHDTLHCLLYGIDLCSIKKRKRFCIKSQ